MRFHINLPISKLAETRAFYTKLFAQEPVKVKKDYIKFLPQGMDLNISFHLSDKISDTHIGIELLDKNELEKLYNRFKIEGLLSDKKREESICCYALQDKFWVSDPNGHEWEFYFLAEDSDIKIEGSTCCAGPDNANKSCCA